MSEQRSSSKGNISADIQDDAVAAALRSVERIERERKGDPDPGAITIEDSSADAGGEETVDPPVEGDAGPGVAAPDPAASPGPGDGRVAELVGALKQQADQLGKQADQIKEKDVLLEDSMRRSREMMERLKEANERMLRAAADLENYKKRAQREKEEVQRFGIEKLLRDLIPVLDNFDRALEHAQKTPDLPSFAKGVEMTRRLFEDTLGRYGVKGFRAVGNAFDPHQHEAVQQVESAALEPNVVVAEIVRGYFLNDRLVRPAMVVVSKAPEKAAAAEAAPAAAAATEASVEGNGAGGGPASESGEAGEKS